MSWLKPTIYQDSLELGEAMIQLDRNRVYDRHLGVDERGMHLVNGEIDAEEELRSQTKG